ncbi:metallophosphoesterase family protein [Tumebacillus permanentifrigoris]|uniref:Serine/threonine protein phosphatase 1 n=1 Tax=Tumebacillus permanentifrigoris TaxID=378543 RepID=A0A316DBW6_9BACL|nr:metallophosphoesterase family protein [Tumebacillus permanentifrigoris]PWK15494.1 serine/threonine protein phosphatase 1 [Tumebacillus permanentifrigoris]
MITNTNTYKVISDIHGCDAEFADLLRVAHYNPDNEQLILLGDYVDRGPNARGVVERVMGLVRDYGAVALGGNHEDLFLDWLDEVEGSERFLWEVVGGRETIRSFSGIEDLDTARSLILETRSEQIEFLRALPDTHEIDGYLFVHAGIDPMVADWRATTRHLFRWIRSEFHLTPHQADAVVVFGHTPTTRLHADETCADIWYGEKIIGIDGGCVFGNQLNCLEIGPDGHKTYAVARKGM